MSIRSNAAKIIPEPIAKKHAEIGNYRGDDWDAVARVIQEMCETRPAKNGSIEFLYNGKVVGWTKPNGISWMDGDAYTKMRGEYIAKQRREDDDADARLIAAATQREDA